MRDFKNLLRRVSPDDTDYGLHGLRPLRVEGWNLAAALDPDLAEAHGGWKLLSVQSRLRLVTSRGT
jgi:hypothetical protein